MNDQSKEEDKDYEAEHSSLTSQSNVESENMNAFYESTSKLDRNQIKIQ